MKAICFPFVPSTQTLDASHAAGANAQTLCANWRRGCNGVTDKAANGRLTLCDDCTAEAQLKNNSFLAPTV